MAFQICAFATFAEDLSSIPSKQLRQLTIAYSYCFRKFVLVSTDTQPQVYIPTQRHAYTLIKIKLNLKQREQYTYFFQPNLINVQLPPSGPPLTRYGRK